MLYDKDDKVPRAKWLREYGVESSTEKRARALGLPWPPYVVMGGGRVYYSRQRTLEWFAQQEKSVAAAGGEAP